MLEKFLSIVDYESTFIPKGNTFALVSAGSDRILRIPTRLTIVRATYRSSEKAY